MMKLRKLLSLKLLCCSVGCCLASTANSYANDILYPNQNVVGEAARYNQIRERIDYAVQADVFSEFANVADEDDIIEWRNELWQLLNESLPTDISDDELEKIYADLDLLTYWSRNEDARHALRRTWIDAAMQQDVARDVEALTQDEVDERIIKLKLLMKYAVHTDISDDEFEKIYADLDHLTYWSPNKDARRALRRTWIDAAMQQDVTRIVEAATQDEIDEHIINLWQLLRKIYHTDLLDGELEKIYEDLDILIHAHK
ncbi:hypothetical protein FACS1894113_0580 [Alphaproteobacteria bacterium]|nr:hypothetical protein FACS1894113_0580 [Alphaproteobacteria bacterium]